MSEAQLEPPPGEDNDVETALRLEFPETISECRGSPSGQCRGGSEITKGKSDKVVEKKVSTDSPVDEENPVVQTIRRISETVMSFLRGVAGIAEVQNP